jgi:hypothetical protein
LGFGGIHPYEFEDEVGEGYEVNELYYYVSMVLKISG